MSHRIFVNTTNLQYRTVTQNARGVDEGLGKPSALTQELTAEQREQFFQNPTELFFSSTDLRDKRRKIQIVFDSMTSPKFFISDKVNFNRSLRLANALNAPRYVINKLESIKNEALQYTKVPYVGINSDDLNRRYAPWEMSKRDFPNIDKRAQKETTNKRIIFDLYDHDGNVETEKAIVLLAKECLADALYSHNGITSPGHPGPGGVGYNKNWKSKDLLKEHFFTLTWDTTNTSDNKVESTYIKTLVFLYGYIKLLDDILNLQDSTLSRTPDKETGEIRLGLEIKLTTATVSLLDAMVNASHKVVEEKTLTFFDETREYKTLLNFGNDDQYVAEAWRFAPRVDANNVVFTDTESIQLKLNRPLSTNIGLNSTAFISREIAQSIIDIINFQLSPAQDGTPYLRPFNMDSRNYVDSKIMSTNASLESLGLVSGSTSTAAGGAISYEDITFRRWFTADFKSSELNIDFTDYNNFVHFGSAYARLQVFTEKLRQIDSLTSASISSSAASSILSIQRKALEKETIIRNFDPYEQFLYYGPTTPPYSASAFYADGEVEYNVTGSWPKQGDGTAYSPYSTAAQDWLEDQLAIAARFDDNNPNNLILNLPRHVRENEESADFITFFHMIGHVIDNIKVYIDQFPNIYSTEVNPLKGLTMDQVYEVAKSFGLNLPNVYAIENLQTFNAQFSGESGSRSQVAETWKRFLHSMVYLSKTKGSRTSMDALLATYGINSPVLQVKETTHPAAGNYIKSDEITYGIEFSKDTQRYIRLPLVSSSITASTVQVAFIPTTRQSGSLMTATNWAVDIVPHPSGSESLIEFASGSYQSYNMEKSMEYGRLHIYSGSGKALIATSSYFPLYSEDYTHFMLRSQSGDFTIIQTDGDQILFQESVPVTLSTAQWNANTYLYIGGSGSLKSSNHFDAVVDEIRIWGEDISDADFVAQAYDPGSYYGATHTSSYNDLYVHVAFSQPLASITSSATNESPYQNVAIVSNLPTLGFTTASYTKVVRTIKQFTPIAGTTAYTNKKVVIADAPVFNQEFVEDGGNTYVLNQNASIKRVENKAFNSGQNIVSFAVSPTDAINQNIMRSMGVIDVNNTIGSPRYIADYNYSSLDNIRKDYMQYFNKTIKPNDYIRFFKDLTQGPSEMADEMVPVRAKLLDGIVIESPVIHRNKERSVRKFAADGTATKKFNRFIAGSGSIGIGAYDFNIQQSIVLLPTWEADTLPLTAGVSMSYMSLADSSYNTYDARVSASIPTETVSTGYARNPFLGTDTRIPSEENTVDVFYEIHPRAYFHDIGTRTYFHKSNGIYSYDIYTKYKTEYLVKLDVNKNTSLDPRYAPVTLLNPNSPAENVGRSLTIIPNASYAANSDPVSGSIKAVKTANIFSLYGVEGTAGLRVRLYRTVSDAVADESRDFGTLPDPSAGVLFDAILDGTTAVFPYTLIQTADSVIYYNITNTTGAVIESQVKLDYFAYEPLDTIPLGYLPRHYRFSRDNTTALKRRNFLGCKITARSLTDPASPVVVTRTQKTAILVKKKGLNTN